MKYPIYAIRDVKVGFTAPTIDQNDASSVRNFAYAVNNGGIMNYSPSDFSLYRIGVFDDESGTIENQEPEFICSGSSVYGEKDG